MQWLNNGEESHYSLNYYYDPMSDLINSWTQIKWFLERGISLVPTRDKDVIVRGTVYAAKTTFEDWGNYKSKIITEEELWHQMEKYSTTSVAVVCGKVSGNLEIIDLDPKNKAGIEVLVLKDIKELLPNLFKRLRLHRTPSGGYHILFRIIGTQPNGSKKISGRPPTIEELNLNPKAKPVYFIETRGEGGYALTPPSFGYSVVNDVEIPLITFEERQSLINICLNYNEIIKNPKIIKTPSAKDNDYYDENPFLHYSRTGDPIELLTELGWKFVKQNGVHLWFTRPGKENGVSGSFNLETRIFWSWSPNWDGEDQKGYYLSTLLRDIKFSSDAKKAYDYLVEHGFGKVKEKYEKEQVKSKASSFKEIPPNFSEQAKKDFQELREHLEEIHPYGIFWNITRTDVEISRERLYDIAAELGFRNYDDEVVQVIGKFVWKRSRREFFDILKSYIKVEENDLFIKINDTYEAFLQRNGAFTMERLKILEEDELLNDTKTTCYKFFSDYWFKITANDISALSYDKLEKLIIASKVQMRKAVLGESGRYLKFLEHAIELGKNYTYIQNITGFLCHEYKDATTAYIILLTEKCEDPKHGGGSGKNLYCELLSYSTTFLNRPASQSLLDRNFFQSWNGERVMAISDLPKDFRFEFLKELTSGSGVIKKLFKDEKVIPVQKLPKIICQTQYSFEIKDGGLRRRIIPLEFTEFFTKQQGVDTYFGIMFPDDWNEEDWGGYNMFILKSIQTWLKGGCKLHSNPLSEPGWNKQFKLSYSEVTIDFIEKHWNDWIKAEVVTNEQFKDQFDTFFTQAGVMPGYRPSMAKLNKAIEDYAIRKNVKFEKDHRWQDHNGTTFLGKKFTDFSDQPF